MAGRRLCQSKLSLMADKHKNVTHLAFLVIVRAKSAFLQHIKIR